MASDHAPISIPTTYANLIDWTAGEEGRLELSQGSQIRLEFDQKAHGPHITHGHNQVILPATGNVTILLDRPCIEIFAQAGSLANGSAAGTATRQLSTEQLRDLDTAANVGYWTGIKSSAHERLPEEIVSSGPTAFVMLC